MLNEKNIKISVITETKRNCKELTRLNTTSIWLFAVEWTDTSEASQEL